MKIGMNKKRWVVCILFTVLAGTALLGIADIYMERKRSADIYRRMEYYLELSEKDGLTDRKENSEILRRYGMERHSFISMPFIAVSAGIMMAAGAAMAVFTFCYIREQDRKISDMEQYCEHILNGEETLDLEENEEGQFSILRNKVYDITVMLKEKNRYLEQNKKETERLIADISHQLKTPVTSLNMINELLYLDLPEAKRIETLDMMQKDLQRIEWFVKMILNLAKIDSGTLVLKREEVSAAVLSEEIRQYFQIFCESSGSEITVSGAQDITVLCDRKWMKEAVNNLVKNAIEHGAKRISLDWESNYLYTQLNVTDDGEGIAKEELPHIFERFYKTKNSKADSVGLGLAFCRSIIENQDGEIRVRSRKGEGTVFTIKIYRNFP